MKYLFIYYTGTYNTRFLTERIRERLCGPGDSADVVEIAADTPPVDPRGYDLVGLGFPIYGFNSPRPFNRYLRQLHFAPGQAFFLYENSGESMAMNRAAGRIPLRIMRKQGCVCAGEYHFLMPYNIHFPFGHSLMLTLLREDRKLLEILADDLNHGYVRRLKSNMLLNAGAFFVSVQKIGGGINSRFYRVDESLCIHCGRCAESCPAGNITVKDGKITFGHRCDMCMRCSFHCPTGAIRIGMLESWRVTRYYDLPALWREAGLSEAPGEVGDEVPFARAYRKTFAAIDAAYRQMMAESEPIESAQPSEPDQSGQTTEKPWISG